MHRAGDLPINTRAEKLEFLLWGSPTLRYLFALIREHILPEPLKPGENREDQKKPRKLLVTEVTPLTARFIESVLKFAYIKIATVHSKLDQESRDALAKQFVNKDSKLQVLIIKYQGSAQGLYLHPACHIAFVATAAPNAALEDQAWARIRRVCDSSYLQVVYHANF